MQAKVVTGRVDPAERDEAIDIFNHFVIPAAKSHRGFEGGKLLTDASTGRFKAMMYWKSAAAMAEAEANEGFQNHLRKLAPYLDETPATEQLEVSSID